MNPDELRRRAYRLQAQVCSTLSNPKRLEILDLLAEGERSVEALTQAMGIPKSNVSQHLSLMRQAGIVRGRKEGQSVYYSVANPKVIEACGLMKQVMLDQLCQTQQLVAELSL